MHRLGRATAGCASWESSLRADSDGKSRATTEAQEQQRVTDPDLGADVLARVQLSGRPTVRQSPRLIPRSRAVAIVSESRGTRFGVARASARDTAAMVGGCSATM